LTNFNWESIVCYTLFAAHAASNTEDKHISGIATIWVFFLSH